MRNVLIFLLFSIAICIAGPTPSKGTHYLIFDLGTKHENEQLFNDLNTKINSLAGYPNEQTKTMTYADPIYHPDGILVAISILPGFEKYLDLDQFGKLVDKLDDTWFPPPPKDDGK